MNLEKKIDELSFALAIAIIIDGWRAHWRSLGTFFKWLGILLVIDMAVLGIWKIEEMLTPHKIEQVHAAPKSHFEEPPSVENPVPEDKQEENLKGQDVPDDTEEVIPPHEVPEDHPMPSIMIPSHQRSLGF